MKYTVVGDNRTISYEEKPPYRINDIVCHDLHIELYYCVKTIRITMHFMNHFYLKCHIKMLNKTLPQCILEALNQFDKKIKFKNNPHITYDLFNKYVHIKEK